MTKNYHTIFPLLSLPLSSLAKPFASNVPRLREKSYHNIKNTINNNIYSYFFLLWCSVELLAFLCNLFVFFLW